MEDVSCIEIQITGQKAPNAGEKLVCGFVGGDNLEPVEFEVPTVNREYLKLEGTHLG